MDGDRYPLSKRPEGDAVKALPKSCEEHNPLNVRQLPPQHKAPYIKVNSPVVNSQFSAAQRLQQALPILKGPWATDFHP